MDALSHDMAPTYQWATRPDDQRFLSLEELRQHVGMRRRDSWTTADSVKNLRVFADSGRPMLEAHRLATGRREILEPSNWAFGQLASYADAPASYLRKLPAELAAINLQWGLEHNAPREDALLFAHTNGAHSLRAMTSTSYGRIWDEQVVQAVERVNQDGRWKVPAASYATDNPKRASTLYASDRDVYIFLVDDQRPIEVPGLDKPRFRGFFTWNSEVGAAVFGLCTFLYEFVCDNRNIWGAADVRELRIRHTGGAPERFAHEGARYLQRYAEASPSGDVQQITRAMEKEIGRDDKSITTWLKERGFTEHASKNAIAAARSENGEARTLWQIVNGLSAYARQIPHTDARVALEVKAGKLMEIVSGN
jgi:hypothetical protein